MKIFIIFLACVVATTALFEDLLATLTDEQKEAIAKDLNDTIAKLPPVVKNPSVLCPNYPGSTACAQVCSNFMPYWQNYMISGSCNAQLECVCRDGTKLMGHEHVCAKPRSMSENSHDCDSNCKQYGSKAGECKEKLCFCL